MKTAVFPILLFLILGAAIIFSGCTDKAGPSLPHSPATTTPVPHVTHPDTSNNDISVSDANTRFAFDLYKKLSGDPAHSGTNLVFSPYSISSAMGVMYEGAQGQTADEIL